MWALPRSRHDSEYIAIISDDVTRYRWIMLLKTLDEVYPKFEEWIPYVETQSQKKLKALRFDHGSKLTSYAFENFLKERDINREYPIAYHPQHDRVTKRLNRTMEEKTMTKLIIAQLPIS